MAEQKEKNDRSDYFMSVPADFVFTKKTPDKEE